MANPENLFIDLTQKPRYPSPRVGRLSPEQPLPIGRKKPFQKKKARMSDVYLPISLDKITYENHHSACNKVKSQALNSVKKVERSDIYKTFVENPTPLSSLVAQPVSKLHQAIAEVNALYSGPN